MTEPNSTYPPSRFGTDGMPLYHTPCYYRMMELHEALAYAAAGGIAVHQNFKVDGMHIGGKVRSGRAYHVLGLKPQLIAWGRTHGQRESWLQEPTGLAPEVWHYDVFGGPARRMEREMGISDSRD